MATKTTSKKPLTQEEILALQVTRSISAVKTKDCADTFPSVDSSDPSAIDVWAKELLKQSGPKDTSHASILEFFSQLESTLSNIGTHGFKLPNSKVSMKPIFRDEALPIEKFDGIISEALIPQVLVYSGDSSLLRIAKFLLAKVTIDNVNTNVLSELIIGIESHISSALIRCGVPNTVFDHVKLFIERKNNQDLSKLSIHPLIKQIYFEEEVDGNNDVLIIPVASESLIAEIYNHIRQSNGWLANQKVCAIGEANPVNGGILCSDLGGVFKLLYAEPPKAIDKSLHTRLKRNGNVYFKYDIDNTDINTFIKYARIEQTTGNINIRDKEIALYKWFSNILLAPLLRADYIIEDGIPVPICESSSIIAFLSRNRSEPIAENLAENVAIDVLNAVFKYHPSLKTHVSIMKIRDFLIAQMKETIL